MTAQTKKKYPWKFFRAGGFDQVLLQSGQDIAHLGELDPKLWVALSCPVHGLEFDTTTLKLIDSDNDGRIRAPEIIAAATWVTSLLRDADALLKAESHLPLDNINDSTPEGQQIAASARQILANLGKTETVISCEDTADTVKIFAQTRFNGDGIVPPESTDDPILQAAMLDVINCVGSQLDRSGKPGLNQALLEQFLADATLWLAWSSEAQSQPAQILPLAAQTESAYQVFNQVRAKVDDYFARVRLAAFDSRSLASLNRSEGEFAAISAKVLTQGMQEVAEFPLAKIGTDLVLPLDAGLNPAWAVVLGQLQQQVLEPLLGKITQLTLPQWQQVSAAFTPYAAWQSRRPNLTVEKLGAPRVAELLDESIHTQIKALIAQDQALEPEASTIAKVDKLVRLHRDLYPLLNNYVNFRFFYARKERAVFQAGRLYLDQRSSDLCIRVEDATKHGTMAHLSNTYLVYCDLVRKATNEKMTIAAGMTAGDSDNLMVGRNGIFYDRKGHDWDATVTKLVEAPISIRQAFWSPYKKLIRWIQDQIAKRAAAADAASTDKLTGAALATEQAAKTGQAPAQKPKIDIGVVAALGVAVGGLTAAFGVIMQAFFSLGVWMPVGLVTLLLLISGPSMLIAWLKLRQRNLGPILDANGWAINARARINIPFGTSLTAVAKLPPGAQRDLFDPFAEKKTLRWKILGVLVLVGLGWAAWNYGWIERIVPMTFPKSAWLKDSEAKATAATQPATQPVANTQP
ncbi:MAG: hypothetical protein WCJ97_00090 [Phycisphaerae bacterium]